MIQQHSNVVDYSTVAPAGGFWTQTGALLVDAYRDLQSRRLFWLTLVLSLLVAGVFGFVGIDQDGISIFGKQLRGIPLNSVLVPPPEFYKLIFTTLAIPIWLGFLAVVLALVALAGLFPDAISSGSIDLYLSRPIGRLRLFLTKFLFALLFAAIQVTLFSIVSFCIIGFRGGAWEFRIFLAIPLVTLLFSYLFCVCVLVGILFRNTLTALLFTALFWGLIFVVHLADVQLTQFSAAADYRMAQQQWQIAKNQALIDRNNEWPPDRRGDMTAFQFQIDKLKEGLADYEQVAAELHWWQRLNLNVKTVLPKTADTVSLMSRWLLRPGLMTTVHDQEYQQREQFRQRRGGPATQPQNQQFLPRLVDRPEVQEQVQEDLTGRHASWILGTSVGFELIVLGLAAWIFCRRDY